MYVLLIPAISSEISDSIYCLNTEHIDANMTHDMPVNRGDVVCTATYRHLPQMGVSGFLKGMLGGGPKYKIDFKSPVRGTFQPSRKTTFHGAWRTRDYNKKFEIRSSKDELDYEVAFRFFTEERVSITAGAYYADFFDLFSRHADWADAGMRDSNYYNAEWRNNMRKEEVYFRDLKCPCITESEYRTR